MQDVGGSECLERPHLHLTETLTAELRFTAEGLLRNERVRTDRAGVHLVIDHVAQFEHVDHAHCRRLVETFARTAVEEVGAAAARYACLCGVLVDLFERCPVENRRGELQSQFTAGPTEHGFVNLAEVHTRRHTQRVQHDVDDRTVFEERHIFVAHHLGHDTFVTVAAGHFIAHAEFTLFRDVNFRKLDDAGGQFVTVGEVVLVAFEHGIGLFVFDDIVVDRLFHQRIQMGVARPFVRRYVQEVDLPEHFLRKTGAFGNDLHAEVVADTGGRLVFEQDGQFFEKAAAQDFGLFVERHVELFELCLFCGFALFAVTVGPAEQFFVHDNAEERRLCFQRGILHIARFIAEDRTEQFLLGRRIAFAFRRDLTDQDIARFDVRTDADNAVFVEILGGVFAHVRDIRGEFLDAAFRVAHLHDVLVDMHRSEDVVAHHPFGDHDGVLEIVTLPRHESHFQVASQCQLAFLRRIAFGQDLALGYLLTLADDRFEGDRRILVGFAVTRKVISRYLGIEADELLFVGTFVFDLNLGSI